MDLNESHIGLSNGTWLGRLHVSNHLYAEFRPLAELAKGKWIRVENPIEKFPTQGHVRAKQTDLGQSRMTGTLWIFGCRPSGIERHHFSAVEPERAIPVIDLSSKSLEEAKYLLLQVGISLPEHQGRHAVVLLPDDICCTLRFEPHGRLFVARVPPDGIVELRKAEPSWKTAYPIGGAIFLPFRGFPSGEVIGRSDWSSDRDFLQKVLDRYRVAVSAYHGLGKKSSESTARKMERVLLEGRLTGPEALELGAIVDRMRAEWPATSQALIAVEEIGELLIESEQGKQLLNEAVERRSDLLAVEIEKNLRNEIEDRLSSHREELAKLERGVENETARRNGLRDSIASLTREKADVEEAMQVARGKLQALDANAEQLRHTTEQLEAEKVAARIELDDALTRQAALLNRVESLRATLTEFRETAYREFEATGANNESELQRLAIRLERHLSNDDEHVEPLLPAATPPWWCSTSTEQARRISRTELEKRLEEEARDHGVLADDLHLIDLFARSGEIALILGPHADQALSAYARVTSGGRIRTHALDPSTIGLDDLWRLPTTGNPTAFALAWHQAQCRSDEAVLLILRNLDATPFHLWLASLAAVLCSPNRPRNLLIAATISTFSNQGEDHPHAESLRQYLVAIDPRPDPNSHFAAIVHDEALATPTLLKGPWESYQITKATFMAVAQPGRNAEVVRRALRLAGTGSEVQSLLTSQLASAWSQYLVDGRPEALPIALSSAHERLRSIHVQR